MPKITLPLCLLGYLLTNVLLSLDFFVKMVALMPWGDKPCFLQVDLIL